MLGVGSVLLWPEFWRNQAQSNVPLLALFIGTILSISALPVIARILMDLNLIKTEMGAIVMSAAMLDDLAGWGLFAVILSNFGGEGHTGRNLVGEPGGGGAGFWIDPESLKQTMQRAVGWLNLPKDTLQLKLTFLVLIDRRHLFGGESARTPRSVRFWPVWHWDASRTRASLCTKASTGPPPAFLRHCISSPLG
jgi:hypothetical protein